MFSQTWGKVVLILGLFSVVVALLRKFSIESIFIQLIMYLLVARDTYCISTGKCNIKSWTIILVPLAFLMYYILEFMGVIERKINGTFLEKFRSFNQLDGVKKTGDFPIEVEIKEIYKSYEHEEKP